MGFRPRRPERRVSTNFTTPAWRSASLSRVAVGCPASEPRSPRSSATIRLKRDSSSPLVESESFAGAVRVLTERPQHQLRVDRHALALGLGPGVGEDPVHLGVQARIVEDPLKLGLHLLAIGVVRSRCPVAGPASTVDMRSRDRRDGLRRPAAPRRAAPPARRAAPAGAAASRRRRRRRFLAAQPHARLFRLGTALRVLPTLLFLGRRCRSSRPQQRRRDPSGRS